ncbi:MAG: dienelactone hydrolase family protein [Verrucomicrobiales bacterium]|nr:dienelactone hydrolase family protein [Verrucomicrobiales bacterium]
MTRRRTFLTTLAGTAAAASVHGQEAPKPEIRYVMSPPPPKAGPHTGTLDVFIQKLKPQGEVPLSFLREEHADLASWRTTVRAKMRELLHYAPEPVDPQVEVVSRQDCGDYVREEVRFNTTPVFRVPGTVLIPKGLTKPAPAVVLLHSHGGHYLWGRERELEGDEVHPTLIEMREFYGKKAIGTELVRRGYVVITIDMFFWGERRMVLEDDPPEWKDRPAGISSDAVTKFNQRSSASEQLMGRTLMSAGVTWAGIIAWDDLRTVDYLVTRPEVDSQRIGCVGHSVGGLRSAYLAALDERIRAAVVCGWMCSFPHQLAKHVRSTIGHTKLIPGIYRHLDHPDIASLAMPRPLMVINGIEDALFEPDGVRAAHDKLAKCYAKAGVPDHFKSLIEERPHEFNAERQEDAWAWFAKWLA